MSTVCPRCGYARTENEVVPEYECPRCGIVYEKYRTMQERLAKQRAESAEAGLNPRRPLYPGPTEMLAGSTPAGAPRTSPPAPPRTSAAGAALAPAALESSGGFRLRYLLIAVAVIAVLGVIALTRRGAAGSGGDNAGASIGYDIRGTYAGQYVEEVDGRDGKPYQAQYDVALTIGESYTVEEITWTDLALSRTNDVVTWSGPNSCEFVERWRESPAMAYSDPPYGTYSLLRIQDGTIELDMKREFSENLVRLSAECPIPQPRRGQEPAPSGDGVFRRLKEEPAIEAVCAGGLAKLGAVEIPTEGLEFEYPDRTATKLLKGFLAGEYLQKRKKVDINEPLEDVDITNTPVDGYPFPLELSLLKVRVRIDTYESHDWGTTMGEKLHSVDLQPDTKASLIFREGVAWEARVRFYKDGTGRVVIPGRAKEFTIEKVASEAAANL